MGCGQSRIGGMVYPRKWKGKAEKHKGARSNNGNLRDDESDTEESDRTTATGLGHSTRRKKCSSNYSTSSSSLSSSENDIGEHVNIARARDTGSWSDQFQSRAARRTMILSEPISARMELSASQLEFFRMLDEKIAQEKNYEDDSQDDEEAYACTRRIHSSSTTSIPLAREHRNNLRGTTPHFLEQRGDGDEDQSFQRQSTSSISACDQRSVLLAGFNKLPLQEHRSVGDQQCTNSKSLLCPTTSTNRGSEAVEGARYRPDSGSSVKDPLKEEDSYYDREEELLTGRRLKVSKKSTVGTSGAQQAKTSGRTKFWLNSDAYSAWPLWRIGGIGSLRQDRSNSSSDGRHSGGVGLKRRAL